MAKPVFDSHSASEAVDTARTILEELQEELQSWYDNLPESFQDGSKGEALQEAIDGLQSATDYLEDAPECAMDCDGFTVRALPKRASRADRCAYAVSILAGAAEVARSQIDTLNEANEAVEAPEDEPKDKEEDDTQEAVAKGVAKREEAVSELESWADSLESAQSEAEGVTFPGMYG